MAPKISTHPGIMPDWMIRAECEGKDPSMITPFVPKCQDDQVISYGLSSFGYDVRLAPEFKLFKHNPYGTRDSLDPKRFDENCYTYIKGDYLTIPGHGFALGRTIEFMRVPRDVLILAVAKSTYARLGLVCGVTPIEPGFEGEVVLELSNTTNIPIKVYANEGICQFLFYRGAAECETSYGDRGGKYQGQKGIVTPRVKGILPIVPQD